MVVTLHVGGIYIMAGKFLVINMPYRSVVLIVSFLHASGINRLWFLGNF